MKSCRRSRAYIAMILGLTVVAKTKTDSVSRSSSQKGSVHLSNFITALLLVSQSGRRELVI
jgi:hypothetical protein